MTNKWLSDRAARATKKEITLDAALLATYAGEYRLNEKRTFTVTAVGAHLVIDYRRGERVEMYPFGEGEFFFKIGTDTILRFVREGGTVTALEFSWGPSEPPIRATKIR